MVKSLNDADMVTGRRSAVKSFVAKAGLAAAVLATGVVLTAGTASASDARNQTDTDSGPNSDYRAQTDHD